MITERLSVFAHVSDADGDGEVESLRITVPGWGIGWDLDSGSFVSFREDGRLWYGSDQLVAPDWPRLPRGDIRLEVRDLSGRSDATTVRLSASATAFDAEDFLRFEDEIATIPPGRDRVYVILLRRDGGREIREIERDERRRRTVRLSELRTGDEELWLIRELSPSLWLESGPW